MAWVQLSNQNAMMTKRTKTVAVDIFIISLYFVLVLSLKTRSAFLAFLAFSSSFAWMSFGTYEIWSFYIINSVIYIISVLLCKRRELVVIPFLMTAIFQYTMAIDGFLSPRSETLLFNIYPYCSAALNLLIMLSISLRNRHVRYLRAADLFDANRPHDIQSNKDDHERVAQ